MSSLSPPSSRSSPARPSRIRALRVLVVDDEAQARRSIAAQLMEHGFEVLTSEAGDAALSLAEASPVDVVVADFEMPGMRGSELIQRMHAASPGVEVIVLANESNAHLAGQCISDGAFLFLVRPVAPASVLAAMVTRAGEKKRMVERTQLLDRKAGNDSPRIEVIATTRAMRAAVDAAMGAAALRSPVLLTGEPGTGKQLIARALHQSSSRADRGFARIRCALLPPSATDSSWLAQVDGGTLFLEEVGELPASLQARLLDVLDQGQPNVRVIASSSANLGTRADAATFSRDLHYRLRVVSIHVPSLRRRRDDIPVLAYHLLRGIARRLGREVRGFSPEALRVLRGHDWPGNVSELASVIERAVVVAQSDVIVPGDLSQAQEGAEGSDEPASANPIHTDLRLPSGFELVAFPDAKQRVVDAFEKAYAQAALRRSGGNIAEAAQLSGLDRSNFRRILKRAQVKPRVTARKRNA